ncbi:MAG: cell division protein FtsL [Deltaproteobacteria bacterium]|nr:cell division protein FtsL [Deltaproteobacteria bacterium]
MSHPASRRFSATDALHFQRVRAGKIVDVTHFLVITIIAAVMIIAVLSTHLWSRLAVVNLSYEISALNRQRTVLKEDSKRLRLNLLALKSPKRIERIARDDLGLAYPSGKQILYVR